MMSLLELRGPDSGGTHCFPNDDRRVVLGHRRLAILDLSPAGHQPMLTPDLMTGVVFNGCIYNFTDLRAELEQGGYVFRSRCDTEVLLAGYRRWGIDELARRIRGMFAFAIWDQTERRLFLVRDRLGIKPLLYAARSGDIAFASTSEALRVSGITGDIDPDGILEFLEFGWISERHAAYEGMQKVQPATIVEWHDGNIVERSYWTLREPARDPAPSFEEAVERTEELLFDAVRRRLVSDVPIAALLSAGTDSTLICWALAKLGADLQTFTVSTPGDPADEGPEAAYTAKKLGIRHELIELRRDEEPDLDELINAYSEPFACSSAVGMLRVCKAIQGRAKVLLTGDGGDDIYLGYRYYLHLLAAERLARQIPGPMAGIWNRMEWWPRWPQPLKRAASLLHYATGGLGAVTFNHDGLPYYDRHGMLGERLRGRGIGARSIPLSHESARNLLGEFHRYELGTRFVSEYMTKVDGASMRYSIEARAPFFDQEMWEYAGALPRELRLRGGEPKAILRAIVRRHLGPDVADRPKRGFTIPVERWLVTAWRRHLEQLSRDSILEREGWIKKGTLEPAVSQALSQGQAPVQLWYLVVLDRWMRSRVG